MRKPEIENSIDTVGLFETIERFHVAAAMFTYDCTIGCRHCMYASRKRKPDAEAVMTPTQCVEVLAMLHDTGRAVHIAGGEVMLYWERLAESVRLADARGLAPHFIETNCSFAINDDIVRERLNFLHDHGVGAIYTSADPYHQQFVPADNFLRVRRLALQIFGEKHFCGPDASDDRVREYERIIRDESLLREHVRRWPPMLVGRAQRELAQYLPLRPATRLESDEANCRRHFVSEGLWEIHIDLHGNIFMNCGIILGHISNTTPAEILTAGPEKTNRFVEAMCNGGAFELARLAEREYGFVPPDQISQPCELCHMARRHLRQFHPEIFGPEEIYR